MPRPWLRLLSFLMAASAAAVSLVALPPPAPPPPVSSQAAPPPPAPQKDDGDTAGGCELEEEAPPAAPPADDKAGPPAGPGPEAPPAAEATEPPDEPEADLLHLGRHLFDAFAPEEIKENYRFPTREEWDEFALRLERALQSSSMQQLAALEPDARGALAALRALPDYAEYADWLEERLDDIAVAGEAAAPARAAAASPGDPAEPAAGGAARPAPAIPLYDLWLERMRSRPPPARAAALVPRLKAAFDHAQVPVALVWVAEVESSFNPAARSPVGARGLFQLMPATAKDLGLRLFPFDERLDPMKNAASAARYLHQLHRRFQDWPLALAAYNAGPARVGRILAQHEAATFAEIAESLPAETRLYVPKVLATIAVREGVALAVSPGAAAFPGDEPPPRLASQSKPLP